MKHIGVSPRKLKTPSGEVMIYHLPSLDRLGLGETAFLPFSIRILLESAIRNQDSRHVSEEDVKRILSWKPRMPRGQGIPFKPARVVLQDFTGVPVMVDLAAMRSAMKRLGGDYRKVNPVVPCDLVVDHSVQVDSYGSRASLKENMEREFERNRERYEFLKWGQGAFKNFQVVPPATGIVHQVNLEYLAQGVLTRKTPGGTVAYPDSLVGTDSHTTMINGLGVVGWGVGGIEAEAVMLGEALSMVLPEVVGFKLTSSLREGVTATDLVLTVTEILRKKGVVGKFVEFFGAGLERMSLPDRATLANMAPEYGAIMGYFPVDRETLRYYRMTGRSPECVDLFEIYMKEQGLFRTEGSPVPRFTDVIELDLGKVETSLAGPKRPQDRVALADMKRSFREALLAPPKDRGFGLGHGEAERKVPLNGGELSHGSVVISAITSCTNTSNPSVMIGAGLLAKKAVERGLEVKSYVKTSLAPGSAVVTDYLNRSGLAPYLEKLGFYTVGYGCTTCIGNSGPLAEKVARAVKDKNLVVASVLSGNRNFEGRINPLCRANYLASPPLVVAYALAGRVDIDLTREPLGRDEKGKEVFLKDIWPPADEVEKIIERFVLEKSFKAKYRNVFKGNAVWNKIESPPSELYPWRKESTYIQEPPFLIGMKREAGKIGPVKGARVLVMLGDSVTTDHISPAGSIPEDGPAGRYLIEKGVRPGGFNSFGSRRGNDRVMTRGTFANIRIRNLLVPGHEGSWTKYFPTGEEMTVYEASLRYKKDGTPLVVLAGKEYGAGSSRDWAAKGTFLLGVRVVLAESFETIHRSNLVGMGVLPLQFREGENRESLEIAGDEVFDVEGLDENLKPGEEVSVMVKRRDGSRREFKAISRIDTPVESDYYRHGGILPFILRKLLG